MPSPARIGLIGPDRSQPCGIADYTARLANALARKSDLVFAPFRDALVDARLDDCRGILVQYERSLLGPPGRNAGDIFLAALSRRHPGRVFVVPHEVYDQDPFAFPIADLRAGFPPLLWLKRMRYRWRHRGYAAEKRLQALGYRVHRVIPLSSPGAEILRALVGGKILDPIPLAYFTPPETEAPGPPLDALFPRKPKSLLGVFGFLTPGLDYASVLDLLAGMDAGVCLLILGGSRLPAPDADRPYPGESERLAAAIAARGLQGRVQVTGYLAEAELAGHFRACDAFLCPMRFKSNSSSLLNLIHLGKPILAADLPLTRYLKAQGAPLELYSDAAQLKQAVEAALSGSVPVPPNRYPWDFDAVAEAYLRVMGAGIG